jgi:uncharacterized protein YecE (DUF72 family)
MDLWVGTSGFGYKEWTGTFYPAGTRPADMLRYYGERLPAVEIDNTFYRMPRREVLESWSAQVPARFRFCLKASRRITHFKRLDGVDEETLHLIGTAGILGTRLGAVLFQLPPRFRKDRDRLERFLGLLDGSARAVLEFRDPSWFSDDILDLLRARGIPLCLVDSADGPDVPFVSTASWGYLRLRRPSYGEGELDAWIGKIRGQGWREAFVFFKHEEAGLGPKLAAGFLQRARATGS